MNEKHTIEEAVFELSFCSESEALAQEGSLGTLMQGGLLPVVDEVIAEVSHTREGRIHTLQVDLGDIDYIGFQEEMASRLRIRLKAALEAHLPLLESTSGASVNHSETQAGVKFQEYSERAALEIFLSYGRLPATAPFEKGQGIEAWVQKVMLSEGLEFTAFLKRSNKRETVVRRLVYQCSDNTLQTIIRLIRSSYLRFPIRLVEGFERVLQGSSFVKHRGREGKYVIWESIFHQLLESVGDFVDAESLVNRIINQRTQLPEGIAEGQRKKLSDHLKSILEAVQENKRDRPGDLEEEEKPLDQFFFGQNDPGGSSFPEGSVREKINRIDASALEAMRSRLSEVIKKGDPEAFREIWQVLYPDHRPFLKEVLFDIGKLAVMRQALSRHFPESFLENIVNLLEPHAAGFIYEMIGEAGLFQQVALAEAMTSDGMQTQLWEGSLTYLFVGCGARFSKGGFLASLIRQMGAHWSQGYSQLFLSLNKTLENNDGPFVVKSEISQLLREALEALPDPRAKNPAAIESQSKAESMIHGYDLFERLKKYLFASIFPYEKSKGKNENEILVVIDTLNRRYPEQLLRLYRGLQFGDPPWEKIESRLSSTLLLKLVQSFISLTPQEADDPSDLLQAISKYAAQAKDKQGYYREIFESLIQDRVIDFESIGDRANTSVSQPVSAEVEAHFLPKGAMDALASLRSRVTQAIVQGQPKNIEAVWSVLMQDHPQLLRAVLFQHGKTGAIQKKLSQQFSESMLRDIVRVIDPTAAHFTDEFLTAPTFFQQNPLLHSTGVDVLKEQLWECTLSYLLVDRGSRFNKKSYLRSLIKKMAAHRNLEDQALLFSLREGLAKIEGPYARNSEMMQLLNELSSSEKSQTVKTEEETENSSLMLPGDLSERLRQVLGRTQDPGEDIKGMPGMVTDIEALARHSPDQLMKLFLECQSDVLFGRKLSSLFPPEVLIRLIKIILSFKAKKAGEGCGDLSEAISAYAKQVNEKHGYYRDIFDCLIQNTTIDFEKIISEANQRQGEVFSINSMEDPVSKEVVSTANDTPSNIMQPPQSARHSPVDEPSDLRKESDVLSRLETFLQTGDSSLSNMKNRYPEMIASLLVQKPKRILDLLLRGLQYPGASERIVNLLPEMQLARILRRLRPNDFYPLLRIADAISTASCIPEFGIGPMRIPQLKWRFIFQYLFEEGRPFLPESFVRLFTRFLVGETAVQNEIDFRTRLSQQLAFNILPSTKEGNLEIVFVLSKLTEEEPILLSSPQKELSVEDLDRIHEQTPMPKEDIILYNAGMVLAAPYLQRLFGMLKLTEQSAFKDQKSAERAIHLLEYLVNESTDMPEYRLVLNKILCGVKTGRPIERSIMVQETEKTAIEGLLQGMISNWKRLGNTSVQGFRESFLQREGRLQLKEDDWHLSVQPKAYDMLLDQIPWSFSIIRLPWMERTVYVKWR